MASDVEFDAAVEFGADHPSGPLPVGPMSRRGRSARPPGDREDDDFDWIRSLGQSGSPAGQAGAWPASPPPRRSAAPGREASLPPAAPPPARSRPEPPARQPERGSGSWRTEQGWPDNPRRSSPPPAPSPGVPAVSGRQAPAGPAAPVSRQVPAAPALPLPPAPSRPATPSWRDSAAQPSTGPIPAITSTGPMRAVTGTGPIPAVTSTGRLRAVTDSGPVPAVTDSGPVRAVTSTGPMRAVTASGPLPAVTGTGPMRAVTGTGPMRAVTASGPLPAVTGSGPLPAVTEGRGSAAPGRVRARSRTTRRPGKRSRRHHIVPLVSLGVAAAAAAAAGVFVTHPGLMQSFGPKHEISAPSRLLGYTQEPGLAKGAGADQLKAEIARRSNGEASHVVAAVYQDSAGAMAAKPLVVLFIGGNRTGSASAFITSFTAMHSGTTRIWAGHLGGQAACIAGAAGRPTECAWADNDTFGLFASPTLSAAQLGAEMRNMRPLVERKVSS